MGVERRWRELLITLLFLLSFPKCIILLIYYYYSINLGYLSWIGYKSLRTEYYWNLINNVTSNSLQERILLYYYWLTRILILSVRPHKWRFIKLIFPYVNARANYNNFIYLSSLIPRAWHHRLNSFQFYNYFLEPDIDCEART